MKRELTEIIEKQRSTIGFFNKSFLVAVRAGESKLELDVRNATEELRVAISPEK